MSDVVSVAQLRQFIERVERLEEDKKAIADDIRAVYSEAKSQGFDVKTMRAIIKLRGMDKRARDEALALLDTYASALGLWDQTPLGAAAAGARLEALTRPPSEADSDDALSDQTPPAADAAALAMILQSAPDVASAASLGAEAARCGKAVTANPFPPRDPRRAAWDEAWCRAAGSDGMEIPDHLKPAPPPGGGNDAAPGAGAVL